MKKKEMLARNAIDLFAKKGYGMTTMRDIAKSAKVNVALIYYYFQDKEDILYYIVERSSRELVIILNEIQMAEPDPAECLKKMIIRQVLFSSQSWQETKLIATEVENLHGKRKTDCMILQRKIYDIYMSQLLKMKEAGELKDINPTVINFTIFGMINYFYKWYSDGKGLNEEQIANEMVKIIQNGILNEKTAPLK